MVLGGVEDRGGGGVVGLGLSDVDDGFGGGVGGFVVLVVNLNAA